MGPSAQFRIVTAVYLTIWQLDGAAVPILQR